MSSASRTAALAAGIALGACGGLWTDPLSVPDSGTATPAHVALDLAWEMPLMVISGGSPAPMSVPIATGTCMPASACTVVTQPPRVENDYPRLAVIGAQPGPVTVDIRYTHPKRGTEMHAALQLVFEPAQPLPTLEIGGDVPQGPFMLANGDAVLRCDHARDDIACFPQEDYGGAKRYASCTSTSRCGVLPSGELVGGFWLCLASDRASGQVTGATLFDGGHSRDLARAPVRSWGVGCSLPGDR